MLGSTISARGILGGRGEDIPLRYSYEAALNWVAAHRLPKGGIAVSDVNDAPYPEVTGYLIPTLWQAGETDLATELARWLVSVQLPEGGFEGTDGEPHLFDTAQAMRGLLTVVHVLPDGEPALRKAAEWMLETSDEQGIIRPGPASPWTHRFGPRISENIHLYALPPMLEAGRMLDESRYVDAVERSLAYYLSKPGLVAFQFLSHFYGYVLEALVDLGRSDLALAGIEPVIASQRGDGSIPALPGVGWICSPGSAQMAVVGYKLGLTAFAGAVVENLQLLQTPAGGFLGSYGSGAEYAPTEEPSWACKYFLDACHWRIRAAQRPEVDRSQSGTQPSPVAAWRATGHEVNKPSQGARFPRSFGSPAASHRTLARYRAALRLAEATQFVQLGFANYDHGDVSGARSALLAAVRRDGSWLRNPGVRSILLKSLFR